MLSRKAKRYMERTGRKLVGGRAGFDKNKVKSYNCQNFGHFARECQRSRATNNSNSNSVRQNTYAAQPSSSNNSGTRALMVAKPDDKYDWSAMIDGDQALMAEISEDAVKSEGSDSESESVSPSETVSETVHSEEIVPEAESGEAEETVNESEETKEVKAESDEEI